MIVNNNTHALIESTIEDEDDCICVINKNTEFYNAIKTADDYVRYHGKDYYIFIDFWETVTGKRRVSIKCANAACSNESDDYDLHGGHIVFAKPSREIQVGEKCCIVPLCPKCNHPENKKAMYFRSTMEVPEIIWGRV